MKTYRESCKEIRELRSRQEELQKDLKLLRRGMMEARCNMSIATNNLSIIFRHYKPLTPNKGDTNV